MKYEQVTQLSENEFSAWVQPEMDNYKMRCCDCGLVHDMNFRVVEIVKELDDGWKEIKPVENKKYIVQLQAKRNKRATGQARRHKNK